MDIALLRTFLAVGDTGSFVAASARLFVTQSAVSLRIQRLEDNLGQILFTRSKAGVAMTPSGVAFERYAISLVKLWEEARQQVAVPEGFARSLIIGAQYPLWPRLGFRWMDALRNRLPDLALRAELGMPDRLTRYLIEGVVQVSLTYIPQNRPGLTVIPVMEDELVLVSSLPVEAVSQVAAHYVYVDWGPEFSRSHATELPDLPPAAVTLALGALAGDYIVNRHAAAYLPARAARHHVEAGRLHLVPDAPRFAYPAWAVFRDDIDDDLALIARQTLAAVAAQATDLQDEMLTDADPDALVAING